MNKYNVYFSFKKKEHIDQSIKELFKTFKEGFSLFSCYGAWSDPEKKENHLDKSMKVESITSIEEKEVKKLCEILKDICEQEEVIYYKSKVKVVKI